LISDSKELYGTSTWCGNEKGWWRNSLHRNSCDEKSWPYQQYTFIFGLWSTTSGVAYSRSFSTSSCLKRSGSTNQPRQV